MIRDTSHQDAVLAPPAHRRTRRFVIIAVMVASVVGTGAYLLSTWRGNATAVSAARLRIAEVTRGTLVRDASVNGRVVAAVSPTLFATAPATVNLNVAAGDTVKKGDVLATLESPDLTDALKREVSSYEQLKAEVARQEILSRKQKLLAQKDADTAEIDRKSAQTTLDRYDSVGTVGIIAKIDYQKAKDAVASSQIRARHASQAAVLEGDDVALALKTKINELERQRLSMANAQRRVDELTVRPSMASSARSMSRTAW
jgi:HlyD family secretion protein